MPKIIVTGGLGYIGSHTAVSLIEQGFEVVIIDNLINSSEDALEGIAAITGVRPHFQQMDMCKATELDHFFQSHADAVGVIHFAALKAVQESVQQPLRYYENNLMSLINLMKAMEKHGVSNLVFSSSATVYGEPDRLPITEEDPTKPSLSAYGNTKKIGEDIITDVTKVNTQFNAVLLRYFNPIGAHASSEIGELPNGIPNNLMPFITQTAIGLRDELLVFGDDYDTIDGTGVRDYIHVVDLANAHVKTIERLVQKKQKSNCEIFNLGTGRGNSVLEVIQSFEKTSGQKLKYRIVGRREGDVPEMYTATDLANKELNWKAERNLDDMTSSSWKWEVKARGKQ